MKILVICQYYHPEPFRVTDICETLVKGHYDVTILTGRPSYPTSTSYKNFTFKKKENINGVKIIRCFETPRTNKKSSLLFNYFSFCFGASVKAFFLKENFDLVFVNQLSPVMMAIPGIIYKKKNNSKLIIYCLDLWPASLVSGGISIKSTIYKIFKFISKWIYNASDLLIGTSKSFNDYFVNTLFLHDKKFIYLPQYAEDIYLVEKKNYNNFKYNIKKKKFNFVFAGNIGEMQSVETIVKCANLLKLNNDILFHVVGDGSKLDGCVELARDFQLENIIFYGRKPLEDMFYYYSIADAMLLTLKDDINISNTLPGKVQSYMAFGVPILGAINGEGKEVIEASNSGFCCTAEDFESLAILVLKFCKLENKHVFGVNARNYYEKHFNKSNFFKKLEKIISEVEYIKC